MNSIKLKFNNDAMVSLISLSSICGVSVEVFCHSAVLRSINEYSELLKSNKKMASEIRAMIPEKELQGVNSELLRHYSPSDPDADGVVFLTRDFLEPYFPGVRPYKLKEVMERIGFSQDVSKVNGVAARGYWAIKVGHKEDNETDQIPSFI